MRGHRQDLGQRRRARWRRPDRSTPGAWRTTPRCFVASGSVDEARPARSPLSRPMRVRARRPAGRRRRHARLTCSTFAAARDVQPHAAPATGSPAAGAPVTPVAGAQYPARRGAAAARTSRQRRRWAVTEAACAGEILGWSRRQRGAACVAWLGGARHERAARCTCARAIRVFGAAASARRAAGQPRLAATAITGTQTGRCRQRSSPMGHCTAAARRARALVPAAVRR